MNPTPQTNNESVRPEIESPMASRIDDLRANVEQEQTGEAIADVRESVEQSRITREIQAEAERNPRRTESKQEKLYSFLKKALIVAGSIYLFKKAFDSIKSMFDKTKENTTLSVIGSLLKGSVGVAAGGMLLSLLSDKYDLDDITNTFKSKGLTGVLALLLSHSKDIPNSVLTLIKKQFSGEELEKLGLSSDESISEENESNEEIEGFTSLKEHKEYFHKAFEVEAEKFKRWATINKDLFGLVALAGIGTPALRNFLYNGAKFTSSTLLGIAKLPFKMPIVTMAGIACATLFSKDAIAETLSLDNDVVKTVNGEVYISNDPDKFNSYIKSSIEASEEITAHYTDKDISNFTKYLHSKNIDELFTNISDDLDKSVKEFLKNIDSNKIEYASKLSLRGILDVTGRLENNKNHREYGELIEYFKVILERNIYTKNDYQKIKMLAEKSGIEVKEENGYLKIMVDEVELCVGIDLSLPDDELEESINGFRIERTSKGEAFYRPIIQRIYTNGNEVMQSINTEAQAKSLIEAIVMGGGVVILKQTGELVIEGIGETLVGGNEVIRKAITACMFDDVYAADALAEYSEGLVPVVVLGSVKSIGAMFSSQKTMPQIGRIIRGSVLYPFTAAKNSLEFLNSATNIISNSSSPKEAKNLIIGKHWSQMQEIGSKMAGRFSEKHLNLGKAYEARKLLYEAYHTMNIKGNQRRAIVRQAAEVLQHVDGFAGILTETDDLDKIKEQIKAIDNSIEKVSGKLRVVDISRNNLKISSLSEYGKELKGKTKMERLHIFAELKKALESSKGLEREIIQSKIHFIHTLRNPEKELSQMQEIELNSNEYNKLKENYPEKINMISEKANQLRSIEAGINIKIQEEINKVKENAKRNGLPLSDEKVRSELIKIDEKYSIPFAKEKERLIKEMNTAYKELPKEHRTAELAKNVKKAIEESENGLTTRVWKGAKGRVKLMAFMAGAMFVTDVMINNEENDREFLEIMEQLGPEMEQLFWDILPFIGTGRDFVQAATGRELTTGKDVSGFWDRTSNVLWGVAGLAGDVFSVVTALPSGGGSIAANALLRLTKAANKGSKAAEKLLKLWPQISKVSDRMGGLDVFAGRVSKYFSEGGKALQTTKLVGTGAMVSGITVLGGRAVYGLVSNDPIDIHPDLLEQ